MAWTIGAWQLASSGGPSPFTNEFSQEFGGGASTVFQNIHVGLSAWQQNHVYTLGQRISNVSNAYQVITAGTSQNTVGSGPTGIGSSITDGTVVWKYLSKVDFNGIQAWANALPSVLTVPYTGLLWNDGPIGTSLGLAVLSLSGHTTSIGASITLTCASGESHRDAIGPVAFSSTNGVAIVLPASGVGNTNYVFVSDSNVTIDAIQFQDPNSGSHSSIVAANASNFRLSNCIFDGYAQPGPPAGYILDVQAGCASFVIDNCLFIDREITHGADSHTIECFAASQAGVVVNSTFLAVVNNTVSFAVQADNTNIAGILVRNSAFFGWTVPLNASSTVGAITADHCCTNVTSFAGNATDGGGNLFSRVATNQFINAATDFRLKAGADCVNGGAVDVVHIPTSDDVRRTARPSSGNWDIGLFESGGLISKIIQAPSPGIIKAVKRVDKRIAYGLLVFDPWSVDFVSDFGPVATIGMIASAIKQKIGGTTKSVSLLSAELAHISKIRGKTVRAFNIFSAAFDKEFIRINITASKLLQVAHNPHALARSVGLVMPQVPKAIRLISRLSSLVSGSTGKLVKTAIKILSAYIFTGPFTQEFSLEFGVGSIVVSLRSGVSVKRKTSQGQATVFSNRTIGRVFGALSSQIAFVTRGSTQSIIKLLSLASSELASFARNLSAFRSISASSTQATSSFQGRRSGIIASVIQAYLSAIVHASGHIAGTITQQVHTLIRGAVHFTVTSSSEVAGALKVVGLHPSTLSGASQAVVRIAGKLLGALSGQLTLAVKLVSTQVGATSSQLAAKFFLQAPTKLVTAISAQVAASVRQSSHAAQAALGAVQSIVRMPATLLSVATGYAVSVGGLSAALIKSVSALTAYALSLLRGVGFTKQSVDAQSSHLTTQRGFITVVLVPSAASRSAAVSITRVATSPEVVSSGKQGSGKIYKSSIESVASVVTPRSVLLSTVLSPLAFLTKWFHFFVPQQPGVLLPPLDGPAEPPAFSAMDPQDQERFVFDWSARSEINDPIASVQVVSIPTGMNFVGPIFIEGLRIEVTLGPFTPPELPMTYGLRCSVTFASGRRSSYTIAIPVRIL